MIEFVRWRGVFAAAITAAVFVGCGNGDDGEQADENSSAAEEERFPALEAADPLELGDVTLGVGAHHGELLAFAINDKDNLERARGIFGHVMLHAQSYDEFTHQYGEYTYYQIPTSEDQRSAVDFIQTPRLGNFSPRVDDLDDEIERAMGRAGADVFESQSVVMKLWRTNGQWYVRWDGLINDDVNTKGIGPFGLGREEMADDLLDEVAQVAADHQPTYFIIGSEMERLWADDGGEGIARGEWSAYLSFFQRAAARIREASPDTKVGAGINWDRFVNEVAVAHARVAAGEDQEALDAIELNEEYLDLAFRDLLLPLVEWGDVLSLMSYTAPGEEPTWYYQFLRRLPDLYMVDPPVVWYSVASPVESAAAAQNQKNYIGDFLTWNAGVNVEAVFWASLLNVDGTNGAGQQIGGRCVSMVEDEAKNFLLPKARCFDGLFDSVFQSKPAFDGFDELVD